MDRNQFDGIARSLASQRSRRGAIGALLAALAGGALVSAEAPARRRERRDDVAAAKPKCKNKCGSACLPDNQVCCNGVACPIGQVCGPNGGCVDGVICTVPGAGLRGHCGPESTCCPPIRQGNKTVEGGCCPAGASVCCAEVPTEGNGGCCPAETPVCCLREVAPPKKGKPARTRGYCCPGGSVCHDGACCQPGEVQCRKVHGDPESPHRGFCCPAGSTCNPSTGDCTTSGGGVVPPTSAGRDTPRPGRDRSRHDGD